ncbi:hypothetical protein EYR02_18640 [Xanthomonas oryzae pv. oryzae]|nr:hypothetical protein EYR02_18640 [Xanthomonas oryzae pv. oryzae]
MLEINGLPLTETAPGTHRKLAKALFRGSLGQVLLRPYILMWFEDAARFARDQEISSGNLACNRRCRLHWWQLCS